MKKGAMISLLVFLLMPLCSAQIILNEVMPHSNNTWGDEWVEIYNPINETFFLRDWRINDTAGSDKINFTIHPFSFALIVDTGTGGCSVFNISNSSCFELSTIGSGLNDDGDTLYIYDNNSVLVDSFSWTQNIKSSGKSWARNLSSIWQSCIPTPGAINYCPIQEQNQTQNQTNQTTRGSNIIIEDFPENATFGEIIDVKLNIYRGNTAKYAVYARVEKEDGDDVSEETTIHILSKYVNYSIKIPIQLKLNCDEKYYDEDYKIIIEGLGINLEQEIKIEGKSKLCPKETNETEKESKNKIIPTEILEIGETQTEEKSSNFVTGDIIESKQDITLKITPYLLSIVCMLIAFYAIKTKI